MKNHRTSSQRIIPFYGVAVYTLILLGLLSSNTLHSQDPIWTFGTQQLEMDNFAEPFDSPNPLPTPGSDPLEHYFGQQPVVH